MPASLREQGSLATFPLMTLFMDVLDLGGFDPDPQQEDADDDDEKDGNEADEGENQGGAQASDSTASAPVEAAASSDAPTEPPAASGNTELSFKPQPVT